MPDKSQTEAIYFTALEIVDPQKRTAYLNEACGQDMALRRRVERMLAANKQVGCFLEEPAIQLVHPDAPASESDSADESHSRRQSARDGQMVSPAEPTGRYELSQEIGRGGMGQVLLGKDTELERQVAVKVLLPTHKDKPELARRFLDEARIAGQLQHPGIVPVYEMGRLTDQRPYFAMKLVHGQTLASLLAARKDRAQNHDQGRFVGIFLQVCQTLAYAHSRGVVHRDLKPANIMVGEFGEVQVMDWGLAKILHEAAAKDPTGPSGAYQDSDTCQDSPHTPANIIVGTPDYLPPEQARHESSRIDKRSDVFGLGGILCEILTGYPPFRGTNVLAKLKQAIAADLADASARLDSCGADPELVRLAKNCLAASPADRPEDAAAVARIVSDYLVGVQDRLRLAELGQAKAETRAEGERRRRWLVVALAGALLLVAVGGGSAAWLVQQQRTRQLEDARKAAEALSHGRSLLAEGWQNQNPNQLNAARAEFDRAADLGQRSGQTRAERAETETLLVETDTRIAQTVRNRLLLDSLLDVAVPPETRGDRSGEGQVPQNEDQQYAEVFRRWGLDLDTTPQPEAVERFRREPPVVREGVIAALDNWAMIRKQNGDSTQWQSFRQLADELDHHDVRKQLRALIFDDRMLTVTPRWFAEITMKRMKLQQLKQLRAQLDPTSQPVLTVLLLAKASHLSGDPAGAEDVLRKALVARPGEVALLTVLGRVTAAQGRSRLADAIGCFRAARASRTGLGIALALALSRSGNQANGSEAEAILRDLVRQQPNNSELRFRLGYVLYEQQNFAGAVVEYRETLLLRPDYPSAQNNLGLAYRELNKLPEAVAAFREAIRLKPDLAVAHNNLGVVLVAQKQFPEGIAAYREALRIQPNYPEAHNNLGNVFKGQNKLPEAVAAYREAIRLQPGLALAHHNLGSALFDLNRYAEAVVSAREVIRLKPEMYDAHYLLGQSLRELKQFAAAVKAYQEAIRIKADDPLAYIGLGVALKAEQKYPEANSAFRDAIRLKPDLALAHYNLGVVLFAQNKFAESNAAFREAIRLDPDYFEAHQNFGLVLKTQNKFAEAVAAYREAIRVKPTSAEAQYDLGTALAAQTKHAEAIVAYREAIRLKPDYPQAHYNLGVSLMAEDKLSEASTAYREAIRVKPDYAEPHLNLGDILRREAKFTESLEFIKRGHELGSKQPGWQYPSANWLKQAERRVELDKKLPAVLKGEATPKNAVEQVEYAQMCVLKGRHVDAARLYADAFKADPKLANDVLTALRFKAACAAARGAVSTGDDAPSDQERVRLRGQALDWLRADLVVWRKAFVIDDTETKALAASALAQWLSSPDLAPFRDAAVVAKFPGLEPGAWRAFWTDVESLQRQATKK